MMKQNKKCFLLWEQEKKNKNKETNKTKLQTLVILLESIKNKTCKQKALRNI